MSLRAWVGSIVLVFAADAGAETPPPPPSRPVVALLPDYPTAAWIKGVGGSITVGFKLDPGAAGPTDLSVLRADPPGAFDEAVVEALPYWRFRPGGEPARCLARIERGSVTFRFDAAAEEVSVVEMYIAGEKVEFAPRFLFDAEGAGRDQVEAARALLKGPEFVKTGDLDYPSAARQRRAEGLAVLGFEVDAKGRPRKIEVQYSRPRDTFEDAAIDALEDSRLAPGGVAPGTRLCAVYRFGLIDKYRFEQHLLERKAQAKPDPGKG